MFKRAIYWAILILPVIASAQTYNEAIGLIKQNKLLEASKMLHSLQDNPSEKTRASLALTLIDVENGKYVQGFNDFKIFYENDKNPNPYFHNLHYSGIFLNSECTGNEDIISFCQNILKTANVAPSDKAVAIDILGEQMTRVNDFVAARKYYAGLHEIKNWSCAGPFENYSGSGFNKNFGPLVHPEGTYDFLYTNGVTGHWFELVECRNDRWQDLTHHINAKSDIAFSQTFIKSEEDKEIILMIGMSGSLKVWLNDYLIVSDSEEKNIGYDYYRYKVKLQSGFNRVLIQTGNSEIANNNFMVRAYDLQGNLIENLVTASEYTPYKKAAPYKLERLPFPPEQYLEEKVKQDTNDFIAQIFLLREYIDGYRFNDAHTALGTLKKMAPECTMVSRLSIMLANIEFNSITSSKERESILEKDPNSVLGLEIQYNRAYDKKKWDDALAAVLKKIEIYGDDPYSQGLIIKIMSQKNDGAKVTATVDSAHKKFPFDEAIADIKFLRELATTKDEAKTKRSVNEYLKKCFNASTISTVIRSEQKKGNKEEVIRLYKNLIEAYPVNPSNYYNLADALCEMKDYDAALEYLGKAQSIFPGSANICSYYSKVYAAKGDTLNAIKAGKKMLYLQPTWYTSRKKLQSLTHDKDIFDNFKKNDVGFIFKDAVHSGKYVAEDAVILLKDSRLVVYPENGANETEIELLFLVNTQAGINSFKEYNIQYNSHMQSLQIEKAELLKKDGTKVPAEHSNGHIVFSSIAQGDCAHIVYRVESAYYGKLAENFWDEFLFNSSFPVQVARYSMIVPAERKFKYNTTNKNLTPTETVIDDNKLFVWEQNDMPKAVYEPLPGSGWLNKLSVSSIPDWNYIANWYSDLSFTKTIAKYDVTKAVTQLMAGNEQKGALDKAKIIYEYIEKNCNYSSVSFLQTAFTPQSASRTFNSKLGDCKDLSSLFVAMARTAGLDANLVLVRTNSAINEDMPLPSVAFNHAIAQLHINDSNYLIELTNNSLPFGTLHFGLMNAYGLYIPPCGTTTDHASLLKLNTPHCPQNISFRNSEMSFDQNNCVVNRSVIKTGYDAGGFRELNKGKNHDEQIKGLTTVVGSELNKNVVVKDLTIAHLNDLNDSVRIDYSFIVDNYCNEVLGMQIFRIPWTDAQHAEKLVSIVSLTDRKTPIDFNIFMSEPEYIESIKIKIPKGKKLVETLKDVTLSCPSMSFSIHYSQKPGEIIATRKMKFIKNTVPVEEYVELKNFISKINQADKKDIAFK